MLRYSVKISFPFNNFKIILITCVYRVPKSFSQKMRFEIQGKPKFFAV